MLARILLDLDTPGTGEDVDAAWDTEIRARLTAYDEGRVRAEPYEESPRPHAASLRAMKLILLPQASGELMKPILH